MSKFSNVPVDTDTTILLQTETMFSDFEVLYQTWLSDGIKAESLIFINKDVSHFSDDELEAEVRTSPLIKEDSSITISRSESGFTFVNFNFEIT